MISLTNGLLLLTMLSMNKNCVMSHSLMSTYFMMDHASDLIWTLDNLLYTYFMLILGFLTSEHDVILHQLIDK